MKRTNINVLIVVMLLLCATLGMGCLEEGTDIDELARLNAIENRTWQEEQRWNELRFEILFPNKESPGIDIPVKEIPELEVEVTRVYTKDTGYTTVVYSIENTGNIPVTWLKVSVYLLNDDGNLIATETCYPSDYPDYGLRPGQTIYNERLFNPDQSYGCNSGGIKIVDYEV